VAQGPSTSRADNPNGGHGEKEFRHAVQQIEHVRDELMHAPAPDDRRMSTQAHNERWPNDYAGHRSRAVDHLNMAIRELQDTLVNTTDPHDKKDGKKDKKDKK
jgi:hypothetical protein